jgi:hypothetical protein
VDSNPTNKLVGVVLVESEVVVVGGLAEPPEVGPEVRVTVLAREVVAAVLALHATTVASNVAESDVV